MAAFVLLVHEGKIKMIFIMILLYFAFGFVLLSFGLTPNHWQYWVAYFILTIVDIVSDCNSAQNTKKQIISHISEELRKDQNQNR